MFRAAKLNSFKRVEIVAFGLHWKVSNNGSFIKEQHQSSIRLFVYNDLLFYFTQESHLNFICD